MFALKSTTLLNGLPYFLSMVMFVSLLSTLVRALDDHMITYVTISDKYFCVWERGGTNVGRAPSFKLATLPLSEYQSNGIMPLPSVS
jgi:hypothetical protein